jgi:hypothetical protein
MTLAVHCMPNVHSMHASAAVSQLHSMHASATALLPRTQDSLSLELHARCAVRDRCAHRPHSMRCCLLVTSVLLIAHTNASTANNLLHFPSTVALFQFARALFPDLPQRV